MIDFVTRQISDTTMAVKVSGELTEMNRKYFFDCVSDLITSGSNHIIIECQLLGHISSSGLALLLAARKRASKKGCKISLTHVNSSIAEVLEVTKLGRILSVYPTTKDAVEHNQPESACLG